MPKDYTDYIILGLGFLAGSAICGAHHNYSYAAKKAKAPSASTPTPATSAGGSGGCSDHIYPVAGAVKSGGAGKNQGIHYKSTGKAATSHRVDIQGLGGQANLEATVWLTMPATCSDGGKNGVDIKFWGPNHSGSSCCYCLCSMGVSGDVKFGGEGPHPTTNSNMKAAGSVGNVGGKKVGFKHVIWKAGSNIHQEVWTNTTGKWVKTGEFNRPTCGNVKTSTSPASNAEVEFRSDCANVVYHCSEVVPIKPPGNASTTPGAAPAAGMDTSPSVGGKTKTVTTPVSKKANLAITIA